jgi:antirestriction protein ArdC
MEQTVNIYQMVTDRIIQSLEKGFVPWKQPWTSETAPKNLITARPYRGINTWLLRSIGFKSNYFLSMKQANAIGGTVKKGEKSCPVVFWKEKEQKETDEEKKSWLLRYYNVFNIEQCEGIPENMIPIIVTSENKPITACKNIVKHMSNPPIITTSKIENEAYYQVGSDTVYMPAMNKFISSESFYVTLFHELIHSTGHDKRLKRDLYGKFGSKEYSTEELIAEMGACYLASATGILDLHFDNSTAYIQEWLTRLKNDKNLLFKASGQAQKATDYVLGASTIYSEEELEKNSTIV